MATRMYVCESVEHPTTLLIGLNEQRLKGLLCDITVRVQGHLFKAHVNILASAMGYFRDLFYKPTKEKVDGIVEIPMIVNSIGFSKVLDFVYTSQLCLSQSTVMQVLCSACYLQIPYVVEKCQEFISTHGHVTSQSSLNAVTGPLLQGLQHNGGAYPNQQNHTQSASASLSLLSQLNQASEKSRVRALHKPAPRNKTSPQRTNDSDEHQECELINTPPSPGTRSLAGDDRVTTSPNCGSDMKPENLVSVKKESYGNNGYENGEFNMGTINTEQSKDEKHTAYSPQERYPRSINETDEPNHLSQIKKLLATGNRPFSITNGDAQDIDHKSLADYFSTEPQDKDRPPNAYPFIFEGNNAVVKRKSTPADQHIFSMTKNWARDKPAADNQHYTLVAKKEKPKKEYKCEYCQKMFGRQQHLKRHILTHTGERPYPCTYCDKRFRRSEHLKHHLVNHEQALGITIVQSKKRQRRVDREDAYSLSKMMLDSYSQPNRVSPTPAITMSGPVILPSMFSDTAIGRRNSPGPQITEVEEPGNVEMNGNFLGRQNSPQTNEESTPMIALNLTRAPALNLNRQPALDLALCSALPEETDGLGSPPVLNVAMEDNKMVEGGEEENRNSSDSNSLMGFENGTNSDLINMEGSEVLTSDLKRLMAAMDE